SACTNVAVPGADIPGERRRKTMPGSLQTFLRAYGRDGRGVVSVMAAGAMLLVLAVAMIVIDTGSMLYARRDLQAATDAAALGAVRQIATAQSAAEAIFAMNGYS